MAIIKRLWILDEFSNATSVDILKFKGHFISSCAPGIICDKAIPIVKINILNIISSNRILFAFNFSLNIFLFLIKLSFKYKAQDKDNNTFLDYLIKYEDDNDKLYNLLNTINLSVNLKNTLIIKDYIDLNKLNLFKHNVDKIDCSVCNICHDTPENKIIKCINNHYFDYDCILKWFKESNNINCPLCFNVVDLTEIYFIK